MGPDFRRGTTMAWCCRGHAIACPRDPILMTSPVRGAARLAHFSESRSYPPYPLPAICALIMAPGGELKSQGSRPPIPLYVSFVALKQAAGTARTGGTDDAKELSASPCHSADVVGKRFRAEAESSAEAAEDLGVIATVTVIRETYSERNRQFFASAWSGCWFTMS